METDMGVVEDVRSALQDFLSPELRELRVRIEALENQQKDFRSDVDKRFEKLDNKIEKLDDKIEKLEDKSAARHEQLLNEIRRTAMLQDLAERVAKLEAERRPAH
ncbi:MAG: hypothetical protein WA655_18430 [Candidatus Korobacteraceae bacterium]